jgi:hypothetical protein
VKNFIPLILAILFIGAGCVWQQQAPALDQIGDTSAPVVQNFNGVIEAFDEATQVVLLRTGSDYREEVVWPADAESPANHLGAMATARGVRDLSTLRVSADLVDYPESQNLMVVSPLQDATVTSPLLVQGFGRVFEQTFAWRLKDAAGTVVAEGFDMTEAEETGWFGPFSFEVFLPAMTDQNFNLEVFEYSAKDGSIQNLVVVPLKLLTTEVTTVSVHFGNTAKGSLHDCATVFPVERTVAKTSAVGRAALLELLKGPTAEERAQGYFTTIPKYAGLLSLVISDRTAKADFTADLEPGGGSCAVTAIRAQIEQTLLQFETVEKVVVSVEGEAETALQP